MESGRRWVRFVAMVALITLGLALLGFAPLFGVLIAIALASLVEQWLTQSPGRLLRAVTGRIRTHM